MHTESEGRRLETITAENFAEELEQQKQETGKAERETGENCHPKDNQEGQSSAAGPHEEKTKSSSHPAQEGDEGGPSSAVSCA